MGHQVVLYSFSLQYPGILFPGKTQYTDDPPPKGLHIRSTLNSIWPPSWVSTGLAMRRAGPDHLIARFWLPFMAPSTGTALRVARKKGVRTTGLVDNYIPHESRPGDRLLAAYFTGACSDFVAMSKTVQYDLVERTGKPCRYAPHPVYDIYGQAVPVDAARSALDLPKEVPLVLFFGLIRPYKGLDILLEALAEAPDVHALVAGEPYGNWDAYQRIIDQHGMRARVHLFTDYIPNHRVHLFFSAADLIVQPYRSATQSGISQIAFHFDKPVIVTRVGGLPEIVEDGLNGFVVDVDPRSVSAAIRHFFQQENRVDMAAYIQQHKGHFSWRHLAETILAP
jgi:D-inositol-3-phosphate glycosyltransferase